MRLTVLLIILDLAIAQLAGNNIREIHPPLTWKRCKSSGVCETIQGRVVLDENWRWLRDIGGFSDCFRGNDWTYETCTTTESCTSRCVLEGEDYENTRGIGTAGDAISLRYLNNQSLPTANSRVFLMATETRYQTFTLLGNEIAFDIDISNVACGLNAALYFVAMSPDGGSNEFPTNRAGAKYGTGYCDASCLQSQRYVGGKANINGWEPSPYDSATGIGNQGACCSEFDVFNSNAHSYSVSSKLCHRNSYSICEWDECNQGRLPDCDRWGCDYNPYRLGAIDFFGKGKTVDTTRQFTVVTQFHEDVVTQFFVQDGQKVETPTPIFNGISNTGGISSEYCANSAVEFETRDMFNQLGGFHRHNDVLRQPMVLTMAISDDHWFWNTWLDSMFPVEAEGMPGVVRGDCPWKMNEPHLVKTEQPDAIAHWANIRFGPIDSTTDL